MPDTSTISILYDGSDITDHVVYADASFQLQASALPGTFQITIRDMDQTMSFITGREITVTIDGDPIWGGYVLSAVRKFAFPAVDTTVPGDVESREWVLRGVDYNIMLDKRVMRNPDDYLHVLPNFTKDRYDGDLIKNDLCALYLDIPAGFNTTDHVDSVVAPFDPLNEGLSGEGAWLQQGSTWRAQLEDFAQFSGAVYYLSPDKYLEYHSLETSLAPWGFSDVPNGSTFIGFRDLDITEDGSVIVNDALIWGGSQFAGSSGQTVFAREQNAPSITEHQRWQRAETHFGEKGFMLQSGVTARAQVIVNGAPGAVGGDPNRGLRYPQWTVRLTWYAKDVPVIGPGRRHLRPGDIVTFNFWVLSEDGGTTPLTKVLPLREMTISVATQAETGDPYIQFSGTFGLQLSDPFTMWSFLRHALNEVAKKPNTIATADGSSPSATYGTLYSGPFDSLPDGSTTQFSLPSGFGYIAGTPAVYMNGKLLLPGGIGYEELDPLGGLIEFTAAPSSTAELWIRCYLT